MWPWLLSGLPSLRALQVLSVWLQPGDQAARVVHSEAAWAARLAAKTASWCISGLRITFDQCRVLAILQIHGLGVLALCRMQRAEDVPPALVFLYAHAAPTKQRGCCRLLF